MFNDFIEQVSHIQNAWLPGAQAHYKMAPPERAAMLKRATREAKTPKKAAVLALFYPDSSYNTRFLLMLRKAYTGIHSQQVSFPGGKVEPADCTFEATALRETQEEVGVAPKTITVFKPLTEVYIPPSNFNVYPFMGFLQETPVFTIQEQEVEKVIEVLLSDFLREEAIAREQVSTSYANNLLVPAFKLNGYSIWGATAMMLNEIRELIKQVS